MATINDLGIPGVGSGVLQPKLKHRWRVTFANIGGGVNSVPLSMQAITVTRPKLSFEEVALHRYNSRAWVGGKHSWEPCTLTLQDDISGSASKIVQEQVSKQQGLIGAGAQWLAAPGEGSLYKFITKLDHMDGNDQVVERWTMEGCWFQNIDWSDLDYASSDPVVITLSIRYDHAHQDIAGYSQGPGVAV